MEAAAAGVCFSLSWLCVYCVFLAHSLSEVTHAQTRINTPKQWQVEHCLAARVYDACCVTAAYNYSLKWFIHTNRSLRWSICTQAHARAHANTHTHILSKGKCPDVKLPQVSGVTSNLHSFARVWTPFSDSNELLFSSRPRLRRFHSGEENSLQRPSRPCDKLMQNTALALIPENKRIHHTHRKYIEMPFLMIVSSLAERHCSSARLPSAVALLFLDWERFCSGCLPV